MGGGCKDPGRAKLQYTPGSSETLPVDAVGALRADVPWRVDPAAAGLMFPLACPSKIFLPCLQIGRANV